MNTSVFFMRPRVGRKAPDSSYGSYEPQPASGEKKIRDEKTAKRAGGAAVGGIGGAASGAMTGASLGAAGGPLAPLTVPIASAIGAGVGGVTGAVGGALGDDGATVAAGEKYLGTKAGKKRAGAAAKHLKKLGGKAAKYVKGFSFG